MSEVTRPFWLATHRGLTRSTNQDRALVSDRQTVAAEEAWSGHLTAGREWLAVADGMGGHDAGNIAAEIAIGAVSRGIGLVNSEHSFMELVLHANRSIFEAMHTGEGPPRMGSTIVAVVIHEGIALIANVGDSRAYLIRDGCLIRLTKDDTLNAGVSSYRHHALTQSLGGLTREVMINPQISRITLAQDDSLILCSDGLTDMVDEDHIVGIALGSHGAPAVDLVDAALRAGGRDNVTVVVLGPAAERG